MSQLDAELNALRLRLAALEEQKQMEMQIASEKRAFPLENLEKYVESISRPPVIGGSKFDSQRNNECRRLRAFLEPILHALKDINVRLENLEKRD